MFQIDENITGIEPVLTIIFICIRTFSFVENIGLEPMTPCVQGRCSSQLS